MLLPCPACRLVQEPYSVTPTEDPALVTARYSCRGCQRRYRDRWHVASYHFWLKAGGTLAEENPEPIKTGIKVMHPPGREPGAKGQPS